MAQTVSQGELDAELRALDEAAVGRCARLLGSLLVPGDVVLLCGPMGAGKTTWTRALAVGLGVARPQRVRSPTYNICVHHAGPRPLAHVDLFRLAESGGGEARDGKATVGAAAFEALGLDALVDAADHASVLVVEWAELWAGPPPEHLSVTFEIAAGDDACLRRHLVARAQGHHHQQRLRQWLAALRRCGPTP